MKIKVTDNFDEKIEIGSKLFMKYKNIYSENICKKIYETIEFMLPTSNINFVTIDQCFYLSLYDYWLLGSPIDEWFYLKLYDKNYNEKIKFITHMDRFNYMRYLNKKEDEYLLYNKYETYKKLTSFFHRDVYQQ